MRLILFIIFIVSAHALFAQAPQLVKGLVLDEFDRAVQNAKVVVGFENKSTLTNAKGFFLAEVKRPGQLLQIRFAGYTLVSKMINYKPSSKNDTIFIVFRLEPSTQELETVEINAKIVDRVHEANTHILDFDFYENNILLLVKEGKLYKLQLITYEDETLAEFRLPLKPIEFFNDCYENLHVKTQDSIFQIYSTIEGFNLMKGFSLDEFSKILEPCVGNTNEHLLFKSLSAFKQTTIYYSVEKSTHEAGIVHIVSDEDAEAYRMYFYYNNLAEIAMTKHVMGENTSVQQRAARNAETDAMFFKKILHMESYNPLFNIHDTIVIFNHVKDSVFSYFSNGILIDRKFINYHKQVGWDKLAVLDKYTKNIYQKYTADGLTYLKEFDRATGKLYNTFKLSEHIFPEKLKVRNGFAYYLTKRSNDVGNNYLYRQSLR